MADATTGWVLPPNPIGGLDHLGVQAPCTALYAQLLPGITNVTDRARYYSFHPWVLHQFEQRYSDHSLAAFNRVLRRAECLFALAAIQHGKQAVPEDPGRHDAAVVGRQKLQQIEEEVIDLEDYAGFGKETPHRYFKNPRGGFGQYYFGPLRDLRVVDNTGEVGGKSVPGYDKERGLALATSFDAGVDANRFFALVDAPSIRLAEIAELSAFCPCHLSVNEAEREQLRDLFLARTKQYQGDGGLQRRASLALLLELIRNGAARDPDVDFERAFRVANYCGVLPDGTPWTPSKELEKTSRGWGTYHRNELLSVALQGLFGALLQTVDYERNGLLASAADAGPLAVALCERLGEAVLSQPLTEAIGQLRGSLPSLDGWRDPAHEVQLGWACSSAFAEGKTDELAIDAVRVLLAIAARGVAEYPYADFSDLEPDYFDPRELHLLSFRQALETRWAKLSVREWIAWLGVHWGIERHLRVALRKLRGQQQDTFRIRPQESGLEVVKDVPSPAFTVPRLSRAMQILRDLALVDRVEDGFELTADGQTELEKIRG